MEIKIGLPTIHYIPILYLISMYSFDIVIDDKIEKIKIKNMDNTEMEAEMPISDILYFDVSISLNPFKSKSTPTLDS